MSQRGHWPLPSPCHFATSTTVGRRSRSNCHTNILVLRGSGAFHNGDVHVRTGPLHRARYADLTVNIPEEDKCHETLSEEAKRESGSLARSASHAIVSSEPKTRQNGISHILWPAVATSNIRSEQMANNCGKSHLRGHPPSHESSQNRVPAPSPMEWDTPQPNLMLDVLKGSPKLRPLPMFTCHKRAAPQIFGLNQL
jgi:hypothetical protein